jgi:peptide/nickel transport system ATP-binding protein
VTAPLLSVTDLAVEFARGGRWFPAVDRVSFEVERGEALAVAGESGCGKSLLARALIGLPPDSARVSGQVAWEGREINGLPDEDWERLRGGRIGMLFQEPGAALDPVRTVGDQIGEAIRLHARVSPAEARRRAIERLREVSLPDPESAVDEYPHRLSGGQKQRVGLAVALAADPAVLIADEPTTALDSTIAAQVLDLLARLRRSRGLTLILISHDLGLVARESDRALVLYAGRIVEEGSTSEIFRAPRHPYTRGLLACQPRLTAGSGGIRHGRFAAIAGMVPDLFERPDGGCAFAPRCPDRFEPCDRSQPPLFADGGIGVRCFLYDGRTADRGRRAS